MKRILITALVGAFALVPLTGLQAQDQGRGHGHHRSNHGDSHSRPWVRTPMRFSYRHCGACLPTTEQYWVSAPRWQRVLHGYDGCGRPLYGIVQVAGGYRANRTVYTCR